VFIILVIIGNYEHKTCFTYRFSVHSSLMFLTLFSSSFSCLSSFYFFFCLFLLFIFSILSSFFLFLVSLIFVYIFHVVPFIFFVFCFAFLPSTSLFHSLSVCPSLLYSRTSSKFFLFPTLYRSELEVPLA
jgi:hypothetical protein